MLVEAARNFFVGWVKPQGEVRGQHGRAVTLGWIVRVRKRTCARAVLRRPLIRARRALGQFPFVAKQVLEKVVAPLCGSFSPNDLKATTDRVSSHSGAELAFPAEALCFDVASLWLGTDILGCSGSTMRLAEGVTAGNERNRFFVVHRHAGERLANVTRRGQWIRLAVGPLGIYVNQTHLNRAERIGQLTLATVALVAQPRSFQSPVQLLGLPHVRAAAAKTEGLETH